MTITAKEELNFSLLNLFDKNRFSYTETLVRTVLMKYFAIMSFLVVY